MSLKVNYKISIRQLLQLLFKSFPPKMRRFLFQYFLMNIKSLTLCYNSSKSREYLVTSGVPQGSNLDPLLLSIFINDITTHFSCNNLIYADGLDIFPLFWMSLIVLDFRSDFSFFSSNVIRQGRHFRKSDVTVPKKVFWS